MRQEMKKQRAAAARSREVRSYDTVHPDITHYMSLSVDTVVGTKFSVADFWFSLRQSSVMRTLPSLALCQLGIDGTSCPSERVFSVMNSTFHSGMSKLDDNKRDQ